VLCPPEFSLSNSIRKAAFKFPFRHWLGRIQHSSRRYWATSRRQTNSI